MAQEQILYRGNIQTAVFPLLSQLSAQTVIVPERDNTFVPNMNPPDSAVPVDRGIPQIFYAHNVMPSTYGFQSVGFLDQYPAIVGSVNLDNAYLVLSKEKIRTYVAVDYETSKTLRFLGQDGIWRVPAGAPTNLTSDTRVSVATVNGVSYICIATIGVYQYNLGSNTLQAVTLNGLAVSGIYGVVATNGYLITWSRSGVAWSSVNDPTDFEPSDISGAGAGEIQDAQGEVVYCQKTAYGFIVYCTNNAVSVTYSGNSTYPFNFKEISAAGGIASSDLVCRESVGNQYAYTTNGLQQIYHTGGKTVLPAVTDFLAGQIFEDFDETTNEFLISEFSTTMRKKITLVSDRYLVLSYGMFQNQEMTHAIIVDILQTRMGKVKINHNAVFELRNIEPEAVETPRRSLAFLQANGAVKVLDFSTSNTEAKGVMFLGKYQLARKYQTSLQSVQLENIPDESNIEVWDFITYNGKEFSLKEQLFYDEATSDGLTKTFLCDLEGKNHSILVKGAFNIIAPTFAFKLGGDN